MGELMRARRCLQCCRSSGAAGAQHADASPRVCSPLGSSSGRHTGTHTSSCTLPPRLVTSLTSTAGSADRQGSRVKASAMLLWLCIACVPKQLIGPTLLAGSTRNAQAALDSRCRRGAQRSAGTRHTAGQHWAAGCRRPRAGGRLASLEGGHGALRYVECAADVEMD